MAVTDDLARLRRNGFILISVATLLVAIPLGATRYRAVNGALANRAAQRNVNEWLTATIHQSVSASVRDKLVIVTVEGNGELHPLYQLADQLAQTLSGPVVVNLRVVPSQMEPLIVEQSSSLRVIGPFYPGVSDVESLAEVSPSDPLRRRGLNAPVPRQNSAWASPYRISRSCSSAQYIIRKIVI